VHYIYCQLFASYKAFRPLMTTLAKFIKTDNLLKFVFERNNTDTTAPKKTLKLASFDLDSTLINSDFKQKPYDASAFTLYNDKVSSFVKKVHSEGYTIVIFTNQKGISMGKLSVDDFKGRISMISEKLGVPLRVYAALKNDFYRKPRLGMFDELLSDLNIEADSIDKKSSFYCGDAAGRPKRKSYPKDFSDSDLKFATNADLRFFTPEYYFGGNLTETVNVPKFVPLYNKNASPYDFKPHPEGKREMILMVGYPGSGKSYYARNYICDDSKKHPYYVYVNRDTLGTPAKCKKACKVAIADHVNIVVDNTNMSTTERLEYINIAKAASYDVRCIHMTTSMELSMHNNEYRHCITKGVAKLIPKVAYYTARKRYEEPTMSEGFYVIENVDFWLNLKDEHEKRMYEMLL